MKWSRHEFQNPLESTGILDYNGLWDISEGSNYEKSIKETRFLARRLVHCLSCSVVLSSSRESSLFPFMFSEGSRALFISFSQMASKKKQIGTIDCTETDK